VKIEVQRITGFHILIILHVTGEHFQDVTGIVALKKINEMKKIDIEYIQYRDTNVEVNITPDVVVLPRDALDREAEPQRQGPSDLQSGKTRWSCGRYTDYWGWNSVTKVRGAIGKRNPRITFPSKSFHPRMTRFSFFIIQFSRDIQHSLLQSKDLIQEG
jgi:hypothetical protein